VIQARSLYSALEATKHVTDSKPNRQPKRAAISEPLLKPVDESDPQAESKSYYTEADR